MTGPEHYQTAELLIKAFETFDDEREGADVVRADMLARAQVHATLAVAAATALNGSDASAWKKAAGTRHEGRA